MSNPILEPEWLPLFFYVVFGADRVGVGVRFFVSSIYLLNQVIDINQTCIDTLLGVGKELIRFK